MDKVRTVRFAPYRKGMGPTFTLHLYDINATDSAGRYGVGFEFKMGRTVLFSALTAEVCAYGHHSVDGDDAVKNVMGWITLKPGDTDSEFFANYTPEQLEFAAAHAETLDMEVMCRFGEL
jgi:hypothetical protein